MLLLLALGSLIARAPFAFDPALLRAFRQGSDPAVPIGPAWLLAFMRDVTALGDGGVLTLAVAFVAGLLLVRGKRVTAGLVVAATLSGSWLVALAKEFTGRLRPDVVPHLVDVTSLSFPSGHAANSAIVYLTLAAVASQSIAQRRVRSYLLSCTLLLVGLIGVSRVYLGVHWPSDVLAGWCFGSVWAWAWWWVGARAREVAPSET